MQIDITMQLFDYVEGDYLTVNFNSNNNAEEYPLAGSFVGVAVSGTINGVTVTHNTLNSTAINLILNNSTLPSATNSILRVQLNNLVNAPFNSDLFVTATSHSQTTGGTK